MFYFTVDRINLDGVIRYRMQGSITEKSFLSVLILDGEGTISSKGEKKSFRKGDSLLLTAGSGDYQIEGKCNALMTTIREMRMKRKKRQSHLMILSFLTTATETKQGGKQNA